MFAISSVTLLIKREAPTFFMFLIIYHLHQLHHSSIKSILETYSNVCRKLELTNALKNMRQLNHERVIKMLKGRKRIDPLPHTHTHTFVQRRKCLRCVKHRRSLSSATTLSDISSIEDSKRKTRRFHFQFQFHFIDFNI